MPTIDVSVVIPAHNEEPVIREVVSEVLSAVAALVGLGAGEVIVVDDASTDRTGEILDELASSSPAVHVIHLEKNVGHGPALRTGWEHAQGTWVAHLDGDGDVPAGALAELWNLRDGADLVLGVRTGRAEARARRGVTWSLRRVVRLAAGRPVRDANTPCKLVRQEWLQRALSVCPADAFAPSVLLVVAVARTGGRLVEVEVPVRPRQHGRSWLVPRRLVVGCTRSLIETARVARAVRRGRSV